MITREKHIKRRINRKIYSLVKSIIVLLIAVLFFPNQLFAQVIRNTGAAISVSPGTFVNSLHIDNSAGILGNNGTLNIDGNLLNAGSVNGNGLYNLKGDWTDNGSFNAGTSTVYLIGTANQTITHGSSGETFYILTINNPGRIITQVAIAGSTLGVLNNLNLVAGTLSLGTTTSNLSVGGKATIDGILTYNNSTTQTATITDILSGSGTINMSGGSLPHVLNLAGATNAIGTFTTSATGSSLVNYNGTTQTVFAAPNYRNLTISNSGIKTLLGNSTIAENLTISGGTFDLGITATNLPVFGATSINGSLSFNGTTTKTVSLTGNLSGTGSIDMSGGNLSHLLNLTGTTNSIGSYTSGTGSLVNYIRNGDQTVFTSENYRHLTISGSGIKTLFGDVAASGILTMSAGDINANSNTLKVTNSAIAAIVRTNGKVIGKLQRAVGITGSDYLYPLGSSAFYNPLKLNFQNLTTGPLTAQYKTEDIGTAGLPLFDDYNGIDYGNEIHDRYITGYWSLSSVAPMASGSFNVNLNYSGFPGIDQSASIIKRTNGGNLELDGSHGTIGGSEITRTILVNGISTTTTDFAIGKGRPRINTQPSSIDICDLFNAFFEVDARGRGALTYQWQVNSGSGFSNISNGGVYSGATAKKLILTTVPYSMNGYLYRCIITDAQGNPNTTNTVLLTVNKIPIATATPSSQDECPGVPFINIVLGTSNDVPGTTFAWSRTTPAGITTTMPVSVPVAPGDQITGTFTNTTDDPITVIFTIVPTGPATTFCVGLPITATVTVNPTPRVFTTPAISIQCDSTNTSILLSSPSTFTSGLISFRYSVTATGSVSGYTTPTTGLSNNHVITDNLVNHTDVYQVVTYRVVPISPVGCVDGPAQNATVTVNPTPRAVPINLNNLKPDSSICFGGTTQIVLTTPTVMTSGNMRFDYTVGVTTGITGNTTPEVNRIPGYPISRSYQNSSDTLQSVFYYITPKVDNAICVPGPIFRSEIKVHPEPLQDLILSKPLLCNGGSDATLTTVLARGSKPDSIIWAGNFGTGARYITTANTSDIQNLKTSWYYITVKDKMGCQNNMAKFISGAILDESFQSIPKVNGYGTTCPESTDGELWIQETTNSTGIAPYTYKILYNGVDTVISNTLTTTNVFQKYYNLPSGNYKLFIEDANGCINDQYPDVNILPPDVITVVFKKNVYPGGYNITCKNEDDGSVEVETITGGNGGYTYQWSSATAPLTVSTNTYLLDSIAAGKYYLTTTDMLGCMKTDSVTLTEPDGMQLVSSQLSLSPDGNSNISCNGGNDGFINLSITGGSGNYTYSWFSPNGPLPNTRDISGLKAGNYTSTITDQTGCILKLMPGSLLPTFTLTEPAPLAITATPSVSNDGSFNINCNGGTGSIIITVSGGGTGSYIYTWSTANGSGLIAGQKDQLSLTAGTYHLEVKDANNCIASTDVTLTQPPAFALQLSATNITCQAPGFNNGAVNLTVTGGVAPYNYSWSNGSSAEDVSGLTQGYYRVTVAYNATCTKSDSVRVELPPPLTYTKTLSDYNGYNISCNGLSDGFIQVSMTSGLAPYIYSWTGPNGFTATTKDISDLSAGQYTLLITDANFCTAAETISLTEPGRLGMTVSLSSSIAGGFNINCAGDSTGSIGIEPLNQVKTIEYLWADGIFGKTRLNLPAGEYSVIITDANNCHASSTIVLTEPDSMKLKFDITSPLCPDMPNGEVRLNITGGVKGTDYSYNWSDNSTGSRISNILPGYYKVTVKDMNGCSIKDSVNVESTNETCLVIPNAISPNGDLINDVWNIGMIELYPSMEIRIFNRWGETIWRSEKGYPQPWDGRSNGSPLPIDSYHYIIELHNGSKPLVGNVTIVR